MDSPATVQGALNRFLDESPLDGHRRKVCGHLQACRTHDTYQTSRHDDLTPPDQSIARSHNLPDRLDTQRV